MAPTALDNDSPAAFFLSGPRVNEHTSVASFRKQRLSIAQGMRVAHPSPGKHFRMCIVHLHKKL